MQNTISTQLPVDMSRSSANGQSSQVRPADPQLQAQQNADTSRPVPVTGKGSQSGGTENRANPESVQDAVGKINDFLKVVQRDLQFSVDEESGRTIITVVDAETQEIVRQIPPEEILSIAENLEEVSGLLFKAEA